VYVTLHLIRMRDPEIARQEQGIPRFMRGVLIGIWDGSNRVDSGDSFLEAGVEGFNLE
jgi:hypothetical protein